MFTQNPGKVKQVAAIISHKDPFNCYRTKAFCSQIDLSLAGTIQGILTPYPGAFLPKMVTPIKSATTGTILNNLQQVFFAHDISKVIMSRNITHSIFAQFGDF